MEEKQYADFEEVDKHTESYEEDFHYKEFTCKRRLLGIPEKCLLEIFLQESDEGTQMLGNFRFGDEDMLLGVMRFERQE
jgi:hypothetical protein